MNNLVLAIVLWIFTLISVVGAFKIKQKIISTILGILTIPFGNYQPVFRSTCRRYDEHP